MMRNRWVVITALVLTLMVFMGGSMAMANEEAEKKAVAAAEIWLALIDEGEFDKSWETVTPMRDPDGEWRVGGYFIK